jgi:UPF0755 protein
MISFVVGKPVKKRKMGRIVFGCILALLFASASIGAGVYYFYTTNLQPVSESQETIAIYIPVGSTAADIAVLLESKQIIRSSDVFNWYIRLNNLRQNLQAGTYEFTPSQDVREIVKQITDGVTSKDFVTILPAQRLDQLKAVFSAVGYSSSEIAIALRPETYAGHPALLTKPADKNLEGYLYPDTYFKAADTPLTDIIKLSLDEFASYFTPAVVQSFERQGLDPYEGLIISSIVEREVNNGQERRQVAQVFLKRYKEGMMLGSDPTALYGALIAGIEPSVFADTPYNTRLYTGLPPSPINNISKESLSAVGDPADTDFLYFVSGDDGITRFSSTLGEHEALTAQFCIELCQSY